MRRKYSVGCTMLYILISEVNICSLRTCQNSHRSVIATTPRSYVDGEDRQAESAHLQLNYRVQISVDPRLDLFHIFKII